jgi:hypothetical protein
VIVKMAYIPTEMLGNWLITITFAIMLIVTVISGLQATQRNSWKKAAS